MIGMGINPGVIILIAFAQKAAVLFHVVMVYTMMHCGVAASNYDFNQNVHKSEDSNYMNAL